MATVCKELFGKRPSFLKIKNNLSLVELIRNSANSTAEKTSSHFNVLGRRIVPRTWLTVKRMQHTYYTITRVEWDEDYKKADVYGILTENGNKSLKERKIIDRSGYNWMFYSSLLSDRELAAKLGMPARHKK